MYENPTDYQLMLMMKQMGYGDNNPNPKIERRRNFRLFGILIFTSFWGVCHAKQGERIWLNVIGWRYCRVYSMKRRLMLELFYAMISSYSLRRKKKGIVSARFFALCINWLCTNVNQTDEEEYFLASPLKSYTPNDKSPFDKFRLPITM